MSAAEQVGLADIEVDNIDRNPDNPRVVFRQRELDDLAESILSNGVLQPISVYREKDRFVLIDGERRWRCSRKVNLRTIPALIQPKPSPLDNLLMMFNIHSLHQQWDLLTIANKLPRVTELLSDRLSKPPSEKDVAEATGLPRAVIRRCRLLLDLPQHYLDELLDELKKPKPMRRFTEDFFIEMERALKTVQNALPQVLDSEEKKEQARAALVEKYDKGVIGNMVEFRQLAKVARAKNVEVDTSMAATALKKLFTAPRYSIKQAYDDTVSSAYLERDISTRVSGLIELLEDLNPNDLDDDAILGLRRLATLVAALIRGRA
ncbi:MAG: ParB/RepB/Spo0J family partition protein [Thermoanaerobaculia bacterium]